MTNWQPIETAPKGGTEIIIYIVPERRVSFANWNSILFGGIGGWESKVSYWDGSVSYTGIDLVSHWMPLPEGPSDD